MNKKVNVLIVLSFLFILILGGSYAYSKYRTDTSGVAEADIANWNISVNGCNIVNPDTETTENACFQSTEHNGKITVVKNFDISEFVYDKNSAFAEANKVAPGTGGAFIIRIRPNDTQVSIKYNLKVTKDFDNDSIKIYRSKAMSATIFNKDNVSNYDNNILLEESGYVGKIPYSSNQNYEEVIVIYVKWEDYVNEEIDKKDTAIGTSDSYPKLKFPVTIVFEQDKG